MVWIISNENSLKSKCLVFSKNDIKYNRLIKKSNVIKTLYKSKIKLMCSILSSDFELMKTAIPAW